jgi:glycosyltransferase involved in cell wall biosynthesis
MNPSKVSVVVPLYNGGPFIQQTLHSVLSQTHRNLEVIVVDDGSTDEGVEVVRGILADDRVGLVVKPHLGIAESRNIGLAWTDDSSAFVLFLDQDDLLAPEFLEELVQRLTPRNGAVGAHAIADFIDGADRPYGDGAFAQLMRNRRRLERGRMVATRADADVVWPEIFPANNLYPPSAVLLRRQDVVAVDGFDPRFQVADDWDLMLRLLRRGPFVSVDEVRVGYRRYGGNASGDHERNVRETRAVWATTYFSPANRPEDRVLLRRWWRAHQRETARRKLRDARTSFAARQVSGGFAQALDAAAHIALVRPLRSWRTDTTGHQNPPRVRRVGQCERGQGEPR